MLSLKQYLFEVFNDPLPYKLDLSGSNDVPSVGQFRTPDTDLRYEVVYTPRLDFDYSKLPADVRTKIANGFISESAWEMFFHEHGNIGITGQGNEFKVFATVVAMTKEWVKKVKPGILTFTAKESNRVKIYRMIAKRINLGIKFIGEYKTKAKGAGGNVVLFVYENKK